jgi:hypothetical protein
MQSSPSSTPKKRAIADLVGRDNALGLIDGNKTGIAVGSACPKHSLTFMARRHVMKLTFKTDVGLYGVSKERGLPLALAFDKIIGRTAYGSRLVKRPLDRVPRDVHCSFWESNLR